jgi:uncharacterized membrane protein YfcA
MMAIGTVLGGYSGAHVAQKMKPRYVRVAIAAIGFILSGLMLYRQVVR